MQVALTIWELKEKTKMLDEHRANRHMRWWYTRTKPPNEMAVFPNQTTTSCGDLLVNANRHHIWRFGLEYLKKKTNCHVDGIVGNTFPFHAKWKIFFIFAILWEKLRINKIKRSMSYRPNYLFRYLSSQLFIQLDSK